MSVPECPVVECQGGKVKGIVRKAKHESAKFVYSYNAIPFAEPPVGDLRFEPPQPLTKKWEGVLYATTPKNAPYCVKDMQELIDPFYPVDADVPYTESEDCLNINIHTPNVDPNAKLAVMVWIYGGAFMVGSNQFYNGTALSGMNDVVVVVPNYRTNIFGFLSLGPDSSCPGNVGLLDQVQALKWIKNNISNFGGDPNNVTIFGESAGAISVGHHLNLPMSKGLFHRAIFHSGQATIRFTFHTTKQARVAVKFILSNLEIKVTEDDKIIKELRKVDPVKLADILKGLIMERKGIYPVVDGKMITKHPDNLLKDRNFVNKVPVIIGYNNDEMMGVGGLEIPNFMDGIDESLAFQNCKYYLESYKPEEDLKKVFDKIQKFYLDILNKEDKFLFNRVFAYSMRDLLMAYPAVLQANALSDEMPVYCYLGAFRLNCYHDLNYGTEESMKTPLCECDHCDDIPMTMGLPFTHLNLTSKLRFSKTEENFSQNFMKYLTNFAKNGDPNKGKKTPSVWNKYSTESKELFKVSNSNFDHVTLEQKMIDFWDSI